MTADLVVDGAGVHAGPAADTEESLAGDTVREGPRAPVVQQDEMELFRASLPDTGDKSVVGGDLASADAARKKLEQNRGAFPVRNHLFDPHDGDMDRGQGGAHPPVSLVRDDQQRSGFRDQEIAAGDSHPGVQKFPAEPLSGEFGQFFGNRTGVDPELVAEQVGNLLLGHVERRGGDVRGVLAGELDDEFPKIGLVGFDSMGLQGGIEVDLLRHHAFGLDDALDIVSRGDPEDNLSGFLGVSCPVDAASGGRNLCLDHLEVTVQVHQGVQAGLSTGPSEFLPAGLAELLDHRGPLFQRRAGAVLGCRRDGWRREAGIFPEVDGGRRFHPLVSPSARTSIRCIARTDE